MLENASTQSRRIRILHVVGGFSQGFIDNISINFILLSFKRGSVNNQFNRAFYIQSINVQLYRKFKSNHSHTKSQIQLN